VWLESKKDKMNPYYDTNDKPNEVGLVKLGELDEADLYYEYNTLLVVKHEPTGRIFYATDSGCSCPTPFEDYHFSDPAKTNLEEIKTGDSFTSFQREVEGFPVPQEKRDALLTAVKAALKTTQNQSR
jgi:hypothetical protein